MARSQRVNSVSDVTASVPFGDAPIFICFIDAEWDKKQSQKATDLAPTEVTQIRRRQPLMMQAAECCT